MLNPAKWNEMVETIRKKFNLPIFTSQHTYTHADSTVAKFAVRLVSAVNASLFYLNSTNTKIMKFKTKST